MIDIKFSQFHKKILLLEEEIVNQRKLISVPQSKGLYIVLNMNRKRSL